MRHIDPSTIPHAESHRYLLAGVAPRPIAFVGTVDLHGRYNLSPFSFFNAFGANPPVVAFSPAYRGVDGTPKHTFQNILATGEFTISAVSYSMVGQASLASSDFPEGIDEWVKAGLTKLPSHRVAPPGVAESPMVMECRLLQHVDLGGKAGSGNLMIGEVVMFHLKESVFNGAYMDAERLDLVARMGGGLYCRASGPALFTLEKPTGVGMGFDRLPHEVRNSRWLTGNELSALAGVPALPDPFEVARYWAEVSHRSPVSPDDDDRERRCADRDRLEEIASLTMMTGDADSALEWRHRAAAAHLRVRDVTRAWMCAAPLNDTEAE